MSSLWSRQRPLPPPLFVLLGAGLAVCSSSSALDFGRSPAATFGEYVEEHSRPYANAPDSVEYELRRALFGRRAAEVERHNSDPTRLWKAEVNKFADRTDQELATLRGWRRSERLAPEKRGESHDRAVRNLLGVGGSTRPLPDSWSWVHLESMKEVLDQGACGSCWAFAATTTMKAHHEIRFGFRNFSVQHVVSCTPNPDECGGTGGCNGATVELALEYVLRHGAATEDMHPYESGRTGKTYAGFDCPASLLQRHSAEVPSETLAPSGMTSWSRLPENEFWPLKRSLVELGPVAVSICSGKEWNQYASGIMDFCKPDCVVDHAQVLIGYGADASLGNKKYWLLQNSWGSDWGEDGYIRILRRDDPHEDEASFCGWDGEPLIGSGCKGGPDKVRVCGTCGLLYDTVVPVFGTDKKAPRGDTVVGNRKKEAQNSAKGVLLLQNQKAKKAPRAAVP